jgi:hypothetical protein
MQWSDIPFRPSRSTLRQFGVIGLILMSGMAAWRMRQHGLDAGVLCMGVLAVVFAIGGIVEPNWLRPVFVAWLVAAFPIGWLISQIVLVILYYAVITPIGLILRLYGRDALRLKPRPTEASYWQVKPTVTDVRRYYQQF